jgi:ABC-type transport system substrate-binding protein
VTPRPHHRARALAALALSTALVGGACSSATDDAANSDDTVQAGVSDTDITIAASGEPQRGGKLSYGMNADSDGFDPTENRFAASGVMVANAVYDPLTALDVDLVARPYLAASIEPNAAYDVWIITMRDGVTFHDGTPLTAQVVADTFLAHRGSVLTGSVLTPVQNAVALDDLTVEVTMDQPWVAFPNVLTSQVGYIPAASMLADATLGPDAPSPGDDPEDSRAPIGTGPFSFSSWTPGAQSTFKRYDDYWREGLPYLDEVEFQTVIEPQNREDNIISGTLDMVMESNPTSIAEFRGDAAAGKVQIVEDRGEGEEGFVMLNVTAAPFDDVRARQALALATDAETYVAAADQGVPMVARGPFNPSSPWYVETDYPEYDLEAARALLAQIEAETGAPVSFTLQETPGAEAVRATQILQGMWQDAGFVVDIAIVDETTQIANALTGDYEATRWRQFGAPDPDTDLIWWTSEATEGALNLNFSGNKNPAIDAALQEGRTNPDPEARKAAYADFQRILSEDLPYIWLTHTVWAIVASNDVRGITNGPLPDGEESIPLGGQGTFGGVHRLTQTWLDR